MKHIRFSVNYLVKHILRILQKVYVSFSFKYLIFIT